MVSARYETEEEVLRKGEVRELREWFEGGGAGS